MKRYLLVLLTGVSLFCGLGFGQVSALDVPPKPAQPVVDQAEILTPDQETALNNKILTEEQKSSNQIGVLTIKSLQGEALEDYSIKVARNWGIGTKENNNGVLLLVALQERQVRIEVGYGLEGALPDITAGQIVRNDITPAFRANNYYGGIDKGVSSIIAATHNEYKAQPAPEKRGIPWEALFWGVFIVPMWLGSILARSKSWWAGGVLGVIVGIVVLALTSLAAGLVAVVVLTPLGFLFDYLVSKNYQTRRQAGITPSWWAGGGFGGRSSGGWGGFGGGNFGGGGASGKW